MLDAVTATADADAVVDSVWADAMPDGAADAGGPGDGGWDDVPAARPAVGWAGDDAAEEPKPSKFSAARAAHYNEFHALQAWRKRHSSASDDSGDEDGGEGQPAPGAEAQG